MGKRLLTPDEVKDTLEIKGADVSGYVVDTDTGAIEPNTWTIGLGGAARQVAKSIIPALVGRVAFIPGAMAGAPGGPLSIGTGAVTSAIGAMGAAGLQDKALNLIGNHVPWVKSFQEASAEDVATHPYQSMIVGGGLSAPFAGGGILTNPLKAGARNLATQVGVQTGLDTGTQIIQNKSFDPRKIDLKRTATSAILGALTATPNQGFRTFERGIAENIGIPKSFVDKHAPAITSAVEPLRQVPPKSPLPSEFPEFGNQINEIKAAPDNILLAQGKSGALVVQMRKLGLDRFLDDADYAKIVDTADHNSPALLRELTKAKTPMLNAENAQAAQTSTRLQAGNEANSTELARIQTLKAQQNAVGNIVKPEAESALANDLRQRELSGVSSQANDAELIRLANANATRTAVENLGPAGNPPKSAEESALAMLQRPGEVKGASSDIAAIKAHSNVLSKLVDLIETLPDGTPLKDSLITQVIEAQATFNARKEQSLPVAASKLIAGGGGDDSGAPGSMPPDPEPIVQVPEPPVKPVVPTETPAQALGKAKSTSIVEPSKKLTPEKILVTEPPVKPVVEITAPIEPPAKPTVEPQQATPKVGDEVYLQSSTSPAFTITKINKNGGIFMKSPSGRIQDYTMKQLKDAIVNKHMRVQSPVKYHLKDLSDIPSEEDLVMSKSAASDIVAGLTGTMTNMSRKYRAPIIRADSRFIEFYATDPSMSNPEATWFKTLTPVEQAKLFTEGSVKKKVTGGLQVKAGMEKGQERRKDTGALFPKGDEGNSIIGILKESTAAKEINRSPEAVAQRAKLSAHDVNRSQIGRLEKLRGDSERILRGLKEGIQASEDPNPISSRVVEDRMNQAKEFFSNNKLGELPNSPKDSLARLQDFYDNIKVVVEDLKQNKYIDNPTSAISASKGLGYKARQNIASGRAGEEGSIRLPTLKELLSYPRNLFKATIDRIADKPNPNGYRIAKVLTTILNQERALAGPLVERVKQAAKAVAPHEHEAVDAYIDDMMLNHKSSIVLPKHLQNLADAIFEVERGVFEISKEGPWINEVNADGSVTPRPRNQIMDFVHGEFKPEVRRIIEDNTDPVEVRRIKELYHKDLLTQGATEEQAKSIVAARLSPQPIASTPSTLYAALRRPLGFKIPKELRAPYAESVLADVHKTVKDTMWNKYAEQDPIVAKSFGLPSDGRGNPTPDLVLDHTGNPVFDDFAGDKDVAAFINTFAHGDSPQAQKFETINRTFSSFWVQTASQVRDLFGTLGILPETLKANQLHYAIKGLADAFMPGARAKAIESGSLRPGRNMNPASVDIASGMMNRLIDVSQTVTGAEATSASQRIWVNGVGRLTAESAISRGDKAFLEKWGPVDWEKWEHDKLVNFIAQELTGNVTGTYDARGLPNFALPGSKSGIAPFITLTRWPIERMNRFMKNVYDPAKKGNIYPLIATFAGALLSKQAIEMLTEAITSRKPPELTWEEYLKLGGKDHAYTLTAKLNAVAYGGILSQAAFSAVQASSFETPRGINNVLYSVAQDAGTRIIQFAEDLRDHRADFSKDLPIMLLTLARDNIQMLKYLTPMSDETGLREERLARRTGFLKNNKVTDIKPSSPFSMAKIYNSGDVNRLSGVLKHQMNPVIGRPSIPGPTSAFRDELGVNPTTKQPGLGYYEFIKSAQGTNAANSAKARDINATIRRNIMHGEALRKIKP